MNAHVLLPALATLALAASACADGAPTAPAALAPSLAVASGDIWERVVSRETGPGSQYELAKPVNWNGTVVYYAHGFNDPTDPIALPFKENIALTIAELGRRGYAVAYSSFSENGYALSDGMQRTHQLRGLFASEFGQPQKSFLMGHSLGGGVALALAEKYPHQYDGAMPMCGIVGGGQLQIDYLANVRAAFDAIYPDVLRGSAVDIPADLTRGEVEREAMKAMMQNPAGAVALVNLLPSPVEAPPGSVPAAIGGVIAALGFHVRGGTDVIDRTHGHNAFDNTTTVYAGGIPAPGLSGSDIDGRIERFAATPDAQNYLERWFTPSGDLQIPVLTLHTMWDPAVPRAHEAKLADAVGKAGRSAMLRQKTTVAFNHCGFSTNEIVGYFEELVAWAR
jgi:pimeloyl-ACP methyl ester carboxylesterase